MSHEGNGYDGAGVDVSAFADWRYSIEPSPLGGPLNVTVTGRSLPTRELPLRTALNLLYSRKKFVVPISTGRS